MGEVGYPSRPLYVKRCKIYRKMRLTVKRISKSVSFYNLFEGFGSSRDDCSLFCLFGS